MLKNIYWDDLILGLVCRVASEVKLEDCGAEILPPVMENSGIRLRVGKAKWYWSTVGLGIGLGLRQVLWCLALEHKNRRFKLDKPCIPVFLRCLKPCIPAFLGQTMLKSDDFLRSAFRSCILYFLAKQFFEKDPNLAFSNYCLTPRLWKPNIFQNHI